MDQEIKEIYTLKELIRRSEERFIDYKKMLEDTFKNKKLYLPDPNDIEALAIFNWYVSHLKEMRNWEQKWLKNLILERRYENEGLNPPFCYHNYKKELEDPEK